MLQNCYAVLENIKFFYVWNPFTKYILKYIIIILCFKVVKEQIILKLHISINKNLIL